MRNALPPVGSPVMSQIILSQPEENLQSLLREKWLTLSLPSSVSRRVISMNSLLEVKLLTLNVPIVISVKFLFAISTPSQPEKS